MFKSRKKRMGNFKAWIFILWEPFLILVIGNFCVFKLGVSIGDLLEAISKYDEWYAELAKLTLRSIEKVERYNRNLNFSGFKNMTVVSVEILVLRKCFSRKKGGYIVPSNRYININYLSYILLSNLTGRYKVDAKTIPVWLLAKICSRKGEDEIYYDKNIEEKNYPVHVTELLTPGTQDTVNLAIGSTYKIGPNKLGNNLKKYNTYFVSDYHEDGDRHTNREMMKVLRYLKTQWLKEGIKNVNMILYVPPKVTIKIVRDFCDQSKPENEQFENIYLCESNARDNFSSSRRHKL